MTLPLDDWLDDAASALGRRLRAGAVPRGQRPAVRGLLQQAFDARERGAVTVELLRAVDAAASPLRIGIPRRPRIGIPPLRTRPDPAWLDHLGAVEVLAERVAAHTDRLIASLRSEQVRAALWPVVDRNDDDRPEMALTEG